MTIRIFRYQPSAQEPNATFEVEIESTLIGYSARVTNLQYGGRRAAVYFPAGPKTSISPDTFYRSRLHYRGLLVGEILAELRGGVSKYQVARDQGGRPDAYYYRANLDGWPNGFPEAVDDDLEGDWMIDAPP